MSELAKALRRQREFSIKIGKFTFTVRRPTDVEAVAIYRDGLTFDQLAARFVVDWQDVTVDDIKGGGGSTVAPPFDREDWEEWCSDRPDFWKPIALKMMEQYDVHAKRATDVPKT